MREILFRGKASFDNEHLKKGNWAYGYLIIKSGMAFIWEFGKIEPIITDGKTLGQFTGLLDKNGNKIFEGDIVEWTHHKGVKIVNSIIAKVKWSDDLGKFLVKMRDGNIYDFMSIEANAELIVIGNIHDNPELLEREDNEQV